MSHLTKISTRITFLLLMAFASSVTAFWPWKSKKTSKESKHFVIIGTSAAGLSAAKELRKYDTQAKITCISCQKEIPYNKCKLASLLGVRRTPRQIVTMSIDDAKWMNITYKLGVRVTEINPDRNTIKTDTHETIKYDALLIATGTVPRVPVTLQQEKDGVFTVNSVHDVNQILAYIAKYNVRKIAILGAGLTGIECAQDLLKRGFDISMLYSGSHMLRASIDQTASSFIECAAKDAGITLYSDASVSRVIRKDKKIIGLELEDGRIISTDMLICATGVQPNSTIAQKASIVIDEKTGGIIVDEHMRTNYSNIYAAGDVIAIKDLISGNITTSYRWGDAKKQATVAAHNMLGKNDTYKGIMVRFGASAFGIKALSIGFIHDIPEEYTINCVKTDEGYAMKVTQNGQLKGLIAAGSNIPNKADLMKEIEEFKKSVAL